MMSNHLRRGLHNRELLRGHNPLLPRSTDSNTITIRLMCRIVAAQRTTPYRHAAEDSPIWLKYLHVDAVRLSIRETAHKRNSKRCITGVAPCLSARRIFSTSANVGVSGARGG